MKSACLVSILCLVTALAVHGQTFQSLVSFDQQNGAQPYTWLVQGGDGNLYGTTTNGGVFNGGTIFQITPSGVLTTFYSFCAQASCADGSYPEAGLVETPGGNFYGITAEGGTYNQGTVFVITPTGTLTTLYNFSGGSDGKFPVGLTLGADGNLYGTTGYGANICIGYGCGTVFKMTQSGALTTLYRFCPQTPCNDGGEPVGNLIQASDGNFYGVTGIGGTNSGGTVFRITPAGTLTTLYSFCSLTSCTDGRYPLSGVVQGSNGNFFGTTEYGGAYGFGAMYQITPAGKLTTVHNFCQVRKTCLDGAYPFSTLIQASDGNLYGAAFDGGSTYFGNVYQMSSAGKLTTLYSFCLQTNCTDGSYPNSPVFQATNGKIYGTTSWGGTAGLVCNTLPCGTVFEVDMGLKPFVQTIPVAAKVGRAIRILGNNLSNATGVNFNGVPATQFEIVSDTLMEAAVPAGATTGPLSVTTTGGTLSSNVPFRIVQ